MDDATLIAIVTIICTTVTTVVGLLTRAEVLKLQPEIGDVRKQLIEANKFIVAQGLIKQELMDELAMRKPVMTEQQFQDDFHRTPPHTKKLD